MSIWIHSWIWMSIWHVHNKNTTAPKTQPQPPSMGGICRPSQGLQNLQLYITNSHFGKYGAPPRILPTIKRMYDSSIVRIIIRNIENSLTSKWESNKVAACPQSYFCPYDGLCQNIRGRVDYPGTNQSTIFT